jgi:hypothetical protein
MPVFPSVAWFEDLKERVNGTDRFKHFGTIDCAMGVQVDDQVFKVVFEAFEVIEVAEVADAATEDLDFTLTMAGGEWQEMLENIKANGRADLHHTLNTLDLEKPEAFAMGDDYTRRDLFYRFNQTLQDFFDATAEMETTYA